MFIQHCQVFIQHCQVFIQHYISRAIITGMTTAEFVDGAIKDNKVVVFSKSYCPFCTMAKTVLDEVGVSYKRYELDEMGKDHTSLYCIAQLMTSLYNVRMYPFTHYSVEVGEHCTSQLLLGALVVTLHVQCL